MIRSQLLAWQPGRAVHSSFRAHLSAMPPGNALDDGQTQPGAVKLPGIGQSLEDAEEPLRVLRGKPTPLSLTQ
jgi:hypothetical protein